MSNEVTNAALLDSDTNEVLRAATYRELTLSLEAGPEGHIEVDGRRCYVDGAEYTTCERLAGLRDAAGNAGDSEMYELAVRALRGEETAVRECALVLVDGEARGND